MEYSKGAQSNDPFRLWTAIGMVAGALERKVWIKSQGASIYPNLYIFLVGPPGVGKTRPLNMANEVWREMAGTESTTHHLARVSLTKAALMDQLASATRVIGAHESFNALMIPSMELGALIPNYDPDFLNALTYLYDGIKYDEQRRGKPDALIIERPVVNLIGCTTPSFLNNTMPIGAWDQGFLSRVIIVYSSETEVQRLHLNEESPGETGDLRQSLTHDIKEIGSRYGKIMFSREAAEAVEEWNDNDRLKTAPTHPRLQHYNTRRPIHLLKLCMIAAADAGHESITLEDVYSAAGWIASVEANMGDVFVAMNTGGDAAVMNECWHWSLSKYIRDAAREPLPYSIFHHFLSTKVPAQSIQRVIEEMIRCGMLNRSKDGYSLIPNGTFKHLF